jgi:hypothetical protein
MQLGKASLRSLFQLVDGGAQETRRSLQDTHRGMIRALD